MLISQLVGNHKFEYFNMRLALSEATRGIEILSGRVVNFPHQDGHELGVSPVSLKSIHLRIYIYTITINIYIYTQSQSCIHEHISYCMQLDSTAAIMYVLQ